MQGFPEEDANPDRVLHTIATSDLINFYNLQWPIHNTQVTETFSLVYKASQKPEVISNLQLSSSLNP